MKGVAKKAGMGLVAGAIVGMVLVPMMTSSPLSNLPFGKKSLARNLTASYPFSNNSSLSFIIIEILRVVPLYSLAQNSSGESMFGLRGDLARAPLSIQLGDGIDVPST
jgi:hypothetical protein